VDIESAVELEALVAAVRTLPRMTQQVLILRKVHSWPVERIAARVRLSEAEVLQHLVAAVRACVRGVIEPQAPPL
jgi:DNA-directed RNA polymerase specialized sigma24 family protein